MPTRTGRRVVLENFLMELKLFFRALFLIFIFSTRKKKPARTRPMSRDGMCPRGEVHLRASAAAAT
jgi:hypothetical protein